MLLQLSVSDCYQSITKLRTMVPVVHNLTNYVVMQTTANLLLALGASPIMAHAKEELACIIKIADALLLNMGTLDNAWISSAQRAQKLALTKKIPIVLDPVGVGASQLRTETAKKILGEGVTVLRGNAAEIQALVEINALSKGVDSHLLSTDCIDAAHVLSKQYGCVVIMSGPTDVICYQNQTILLTNGTPMLTRVTGMGCAASAIIAAFLSVVGDPVQASVYAISTFNLAAEKAVKQANGPGSFSVKLLDAVANIQEEDFTVVSAEIFYI